MALMCQITTIDGRIFDAPITLKVLTEWEQRTGKNIGYLATPDANDFAYIAWRAAHYSHKISRFTTFNKFKKITVGWDILNIQPNAVEQIEEWLKYQ